MGISDSPSDVELLRLMLAGDEDAFVALYRRRQAGVYRFAMQMCGSPTVAEDVTQEVFIVLMREAQKFDPTRGSLAAYLYGIARNHVLRALERERAFVPIADEDGDAEVAPAHEKFIAQTDLLADLSRNETIEKVRQAVLALPAHYREIVVLCELHEMSYTEAAAALGCAVGTVRSRLHRGRAMLIEKLRASVATEANDDQRPTTHTAKTVRCFA
ncbi:MAG TPA: RNA polymerase sigma factor [Pyrinomonadaceae bacterium]|jgi:RNA polymerase sigma-70 factor (ECF subfamily)